MTCPGYGLVAGFSVETVVVALLAVAPLPDDLQPRINDFTTRQPIALRFASSDAELPALARKVPAENITDRQTIKRRIDTWRPDYQRV